MSIKRMALLSPTHFAAGHGSEWQRRMLSAALDLKHAGICANLHDSAYETTGDFIWRCHPDPITWRDWRFLLGKEIDPHCEDERGNE